MNIWKLYLKAYSQDFNCEKSWGYISEPITAISNIAFLISSYFAFRLLSKNTTTDPKLRRLPWFIGLIGIGSGLYHSFNNPYTLIGDLLPIYFFILYSVFLILQKAFKNILIAYSISLTLILIQLLSLTNLPQSFIGVPTHHIINLSFFILLFYWLYRRIGRVALWFIPVLLVYALALLSRTVDLLVSPITKIGTHSVWHIIVSLAAYLTVVFLVKLELNEIKS